MAQYNIIAESNNFIVLDTYTKYNELHEAPVAYQSEASLECEFIQDLVNQGYEYRPDISTPDTLLANARMKIQELNNVEFSDMEWLRFVEEYLDKPGDTLIDKTRKIHDNYIYDFVFDDGSASISVACNRRNLPRPVRGGISSRGLAARGRDLRPPTHSSRCRQQHWCGRCCYRPVHHGNSGCR